MKIDQTPQRELPQLYDLLGDAPSSSDATGYADWLGQRLRELTGAEKDERRGFGEVPARRLLLVGGLLCHGQGNLRSDRLGYSSYGAWLGEVVGLGAAQVRRYRIACDRLAASVILEHRLGIGAAYQIALCDAALRDPLLVAWGKGARIADLGLARRTVAPLWESLGARRGAALIEAICASGRVPDDLGTHTDRDGAGHLHDGAGRLRRAGRACERLAAAVMPLLGQDPEIAAALALLQRRIAEAERPASPAAPAQSGGKTEQPAQSGGKSAHPAQGGGTPAAPARPSTPPVHPERDQGSPHDPPASTDGPAGPPRFHPTWSTLDRETFAQLYDPLPPLDPVQSGSVEVYVPPQLKALEQELAEQEEQTRQEALLHRYDDLCPDPRIRQIFIHMDEREEQRRQYNSPEARARRAELDARAEAAYRRLDEQAAQAAQATQAAQAAAHTPGATP